MANSKVSALSAITDPISTDEIYIVDDAVGTPASKKVTLSNLSKGLGAASATVQGAVELATDAETNTGTATDRALTPANITAWTGGTALVTLGTIATGVWNGTAVAPAYGGTGIANNAASTWTVSGNFATTVTVSGTTTVTLPTSGTLMANLSEDTTPQLGGDLDLNGNTVYGAETDDGTAGAADTIDWGAANNHKSTLDENVTYTFTAPAGPAHLTLRMVQDGSGTNTVTWPATVKWQSATEPAWTTGAADVNLAFFYYDGTSYYGSGIIDAS